MRFTVMGAKTPVETSQILFLNFLYAFQLCSSSSSAGRPQHEYQDKPRFPGALNSYYTEKLEFDDPDDGEAIPVYRVMDRNGKVFNEAHDPKVCCWFFLPPFSLIFFFQGDREVVASSFPQTFRQAFLFFCLSRYDRFSRFQGEEFSYCCINRRVPLTLPWGCVGGWVI